MIEDLAVAAARIVERTRAEQGLAPVIDDVETLTKVAAIMLGRDGAR